MIRKVRDVKKTSTMPAGLNVRMEKFLASTTVALRIMFAVMDN